MHRTLMRIARPFATTLAVAAVAGAVSIARPAAQTPVRVRVQTELGDIVLEIDTRRAPNTAANFLRYLNAGHYDGGIFHRTVKMDNQPDSPVKIEVIQAGVNPDRAKDGFAPIPIERTSATGLHHTDGVISMARGQPDSATSGTGWPAAWGCASMWGGSCSINCSMTSTTRGSNCWPVSFRNSATISGSGSALR